jgi:hypothetical protein
VFGNPAQVTTAAIRTTDGSVTIEVPASQTVRVVRGGQDSLDLFASISGIRAAIGNVTRPIDNELNAVRADHTVLSSHVASQTTRLQDTMDERFESQQELGANASRMYAELSAATSTLQRQVACGATGMIWNGNTCVGPSPRVPTDAELVDCTAAILGQQRYHRADKMLQACIDPPRWAQAATSVIGTQSNPAPSCVAIHAAGYDTGVHYITGSNGNAPIPVFCDNTRAGGGWTLINKIAASHSIANWGYSSSSWSSSTSTLNHPGEMNLGNGDYKSPAYSRLAFTQVRIFIGNTLGDGFIENTGAKASLHSLLNGATVNSRYNRNAFLAAMNAAGTSGSRWNNQPNCNVAGFNTNQINGDHRCRWGLIMNNEGDCGSSDAAIGVGCQTNFNSCRSCTARRVGAGGFTWNPDVRYPKQAWMFVR